MSTIRSFITKGLLAGALACGMATSAGAATTINLTSVGQGVGSITNNVGTFSAGGITVKVTAWTLSGTGTSGTISRSTLQLWDGGLGVTNSGDNGGSSGQHTVDNNNGRDFLIFQFSTLVDPVSAELNTYSVLGKDKDSDATIAFGDSALAYNTIPGLVGKNQADLKALVNGGNFWDNLTSNGNDRTLSLDQSAQLSGKIGDMLMIGAIFNDADGKVNGQQKSIDGFKVQSITVNNAVPEPATWAMMITGFGFVGGSMRRRTAKTAALTA